MSQISQINVEGKSYFLPPTDNQHYKALAELKTPNVGNWYIYYNIWDFEHNKWIPVKFYTDFLNSKQWKTFSPKKRLLEANKILNQCNIELQQNINPKTTKAIAPFDNRTLENLIDDAKDASPVPKLEEAIQKFVALKSGKLGKAGASENKENTAVTYKYFFNQFLEYCKGEKIEHLKLHKFQRYQVYNFMEQNYNSGSWGNQTYNNYLGYIKSFFNHYAKIYDYKNVIEHLEDKEITDDSERFEPFTVEQLKEVLDFVDNDHQIVYPHYTRTVEADKFLSVISRVILYTFLRPSEIARIKIKHVKRYQEGFFDLTSDITKNKKKVFNELYIEPSLVEIFKTLGWEKYFNDKKFENYYVFTADLSPSTTKAIKYNFSKKFATVLEKVSQTVELIPEDVNGKQKLIRKVTIKKSYERGNYSLYSLKHTGNIIAYKAGFTLTQLQLQNRHSSVQQTENYLRKLKQEINEGQRPLRPIF